VLLDPPEDLTDELIRRYTALGQAQANYDMHPTTLNLLVLNTARNALGKTLDKCSVELGQALTPRPTVSVQEDSTLKLLYPTP
jgi:hypothetical protein